MSSTPSRPPQKAAHDGFVGEIVEPAAWRVGQQLGVLQQAQHARAEQRSGGRAHENPLPVGIADAVGVAGAQVGVETEAERIGQHLAQQVHGQARRAQGKLDGEMHGPKARAGFAKRKHRRTAGR